MEPAAVLVVPLEVEAVHHVERRQLLLGEAEEAGACLPLRREGRDRDVARLEEYQHRGRLRAGDGRHRASRR